MNKISCRYLLMAGLCTLLVTGCSKPLVSVENIEGIEGVEGVESGEAEECWQFRRY